MSRDQRVDDGRLEAEHGKLDYRDSTDDEEVRLLPHRRGVDEPNPPSSDIRDGPNTSDTQRDEWLLKTEPLQGAHPKWNIGFWTLKSLGAWGSECGATWNSGPSVATRAADLTGGRGDYTEGGGSSRARGPSGSRASSFARRDTSSASDFYGRPIKGRRFGPTE